MEVIYRQAKWDDILCLGRHTQRNPHWRKVSLCNQKIQNTTLGWCSIASCWGPGEDLASEVERVTHGISGASKLQNNPTEIANALRSKAMTRFLRSAVKFLLSTTGTSLELWQQNGALYLCLGRSCSTLSNSSPCPGFLRGSWLWTFGLGNDGFHLALSQESWPLLSFLQTRSIVVRVFVNCSNFGLRFGFILRKISIALRLTNITPSGKQRVYLSPLWYILDQQPGGISWKDDVDCSHLTAPLRKTRSLCILVRRS